MKEVLTETKNRPPFVLKLGATLYIIADNNVLVKTTRTAEALYTLICCYYVFHIHFSKEVLPSLTFIQHEILEDKTDASAPAAVLIFVKQLLAEIEEGNSTEQSGDDEQSSDQDDSD